MHSRPAFNKVVIAIIALATLTNCSGPKRIKFPEPVDTKTRPITHQKKQLLAIPELGLYLDNTFAGARLNGFQKTNDSTITLYIQPENQPINNSPYYAFKTWADHQKPVYFTFHYPKGYKHRYIPKLKQNGAPWTIVDSSQYSFRDSIFTLKVKVSPDTTLIAAQEIYNSKLTKAWYTGLANANPTAVRLKSAGSTPGNRDIPYLDLYQGSAKGKDVVILITRQHPPEVTGFMAFQSFLETILDHSALSKSFLNKYRVLAFPIMNPDGVDLGHWRHNAGGVDLNRDWSKYRQPEIRQVVSTIEEVLKKDQGKVLLGLDFHSTWYDVFYTNDQRKGTTIPNFLPQWFAGLENNIPNYTVNEKSSTSTKPVSKGWFLNRFKAIGITYEIGDDTPRDFIALKGRVSAQEMMRILVNMNN